MSPSRRSTWATYLRLVEVTAATLGLEDPSSLDLADDARVLQEQRLMDALSAGLKKGEPRASEVLDVVGLSKPNFRQHVRMIARWRPALRQQLADGASFNVLEKFGHEARMKLLDDLPPLRGKVAEQRQTILRHLYSKQAPRAASKRLGWLPGVKPERAEGRSHESVWLYDPRDVQSPDALHPRVARTLIASCLDKPGKVADPMAGTGVIGLEAQKLGHDAWVSDSHPGAPFIKRVEIGVDGLKDVLDGELFDLIVLHPPVSSKLSTTENSDYEAWLDGILLGLSGSLKVGGKLALIISNREAPLFLERATSFLQGVLASKNPVLGPETGLWRHFLAVAKDGREAWHILVGIKREHWADDGTTPVCPVPS